MQMAIKTSIFRFEFSRSFKKVIDIDLFVLERVPYIQVL